jgi:flagellar basal body-associated protein FliL
MSQKRKAQRARHEAEVAKKGKDVVMWIIIALIAFAVVYMGITIWGMM